MSVLDLGGHSDCASQCPLSGGKSGRGFRSAKCPLMTQSGHRQNSDSNRLATRRAISAGASSGIGNIELTLISPST